MSEEEVRARVEEARSHHLRGDLKRAIVIYQEILRGDPNLAAVWHLKGMAEHQAGDLAQAGASAAQAIERGGENPQFLFLEGGVLHDRGDLEGAAGRFARVAAARPDWAAGHVELGLVLMDQGKVAAALESFRAAVSADPKNARAWNNLGTALQSLDRMDEAVRAFNHVVTLVEVDGRARWVDPTLTSQGGTVERLHFPDYRRALVLREGTSALTDVPAPNVATPASTVSETFVVKDYTSPVEFTVETRYEGHEADRMRGDLRSRSRQELERRYLKFYAQTYPGVKSLGPLDVKDDLPANTLAVKERYSIPEFWALSEDQSQRRFELTPSSIDEAVKRPETGTRVAPLSIPYPVHVKHVTDVVLPKDWNVRAESTVVGGKAMRFSYRSTYANRRVRLEYTYRSLADSVAPGDLPSHAKDVDRIRDLLTFQITSPLAPAKAAAEQSVGLNWSVAVLAALFFGLSLLGGAYVYRFRPAPAPRRVGLPLPAPLSIGGWLILVGFGILASPLRLCVDLGRLVPAYSLDNWLTLTTPGGEGYHALWAPLLIFELVGNIFFVVFSILLAVLFVQRRRSLPLAYVVFLVLNTLFLVADTLFAAMVTPLKGSDAASFLAQMGRNVVPMVIWIPYFLVSRRVKETFVS